MKIMNSATAYSANLSNIFVVLGQGSGTARLLQSGSFFL